jgi:hypothetical protein
MAHPLLLFMSKTATLPSPPAAASQLPSIEASFCTKGEPSAQVLGTATLAAGDRHARELMAAPPPRRKMLSGFQAPPGRAAATPTAPLTSPVLMQLDGCCVKRRQVAAATMAMTFESRCPFLCAVGIVSTQLCYLYTAAHSGNCSLASNFHMLSVV